MGSRCDCMIKLYTKNSGREIPKNLGRPTGQLVLFLIILNQTPLCEVYYVESTLHWCHQKLWPLLIWYEDWLSVQHLKVQVWGVSEVVVHDGLGITWKFESLHQILLGVVHLNRVGCPERVFQLYASLGPNHMSWITKNILSRAFTARGFEFWSVIVTLWCLIEDMPY